MLRETWRLSLRYIGVGVCFAVAASITLFGFQFLTITKSVAFGVALAFGFALSYLFWQATRVRKAVVAPNVEIQGTSSVLFGNENLELQQLASNTCFFWTTYAGEPAQSEIETPAIAAPSNAPKVVTISDADIH
jgi:hypothetical protein